MTAIVQMEYRQATIDEIFRLRFAMLRPGVTPVRVYFSGDDGAPPATWHFGAFDRGAAGGGNGVATTDPCVGCLTLFSSIWNGAPAMQLRGMAVADCYRRMGIGTRLLRTAVQVVARWAEAPPVWWCNARAEAVRFYERNGWQVMSEAFMIEGVGIHKKMVQVRW